MSPQISLDPVLVELSQISVRIDERDILKHVDFVLHEREIVTLIGPNGAGKTTAFNLLTGVYQPTTGTIDFAGKSLVGLKPYQITSRGIARTFQNIRLFSELTVLDNVKIAYDSHAKYSLVESVLRLGRYFKEEDEITLPT